MPRVRDPEGWRWGSACCRSAQLPTVGSLGTINRSAYVIIRHMSYVKRHTSHHTPQIKRHTSHFSFQVSRQRSAQIEKGRKVGGGEREERNSKKGDGIGERYAGVVATRMLKKVAEVYSQNRTM